MDFDFILDMVHRAAALVGDRLDARDRASLTHVSGFDCEAALSCLREGLGAEPGLSETSQRRLIIPLDRCAVALGWASTGTRGFRAGVRGHATCGVSAAGLTPTGVFSSPLCHQLC